MVDKTNKAGRNWFALLSHEKLYYIGIGPKCGFFHSVGISFKKAEAGKEPATTGKQFDAD
ncbi:MAG: hypothetical protein Kow0027_25360 [Saprospiraceae bacterium]